MLQFCIDNNLSITNTRFKHHKRRLYTWKSPGDRYRNQIDYILINERWNTSIINTKTLPGVDCGSDHQLLMTKIQIKLKTGKQGRKMQKLTQTAKDKYNDIIKPQLAAFKPRVTELDVNSQWEALKLEIIKAKENAQKQTRQDKTIQAKKPWIKDETLSKIEEKKI